LRIGEQSSGGIGRPGLAEDFNNLPRSSALLTRTVADSVGERRKRPKGCYYL